MSAKVAILVGVYNGERFLGELIESISAQTSPGWEAIFVDDGSTDSSADILARFAARDSRVTVVCQENGGVGSARNTALERTQAPYFMFADQDDLLKPDAVATALAAIERTHADIVRFQSNRHCRKSPFVWERIFRRAAVGEIRFAPLTGGEDTAFLWELGLAGLEENEIDDELYWNRPDVGSFSRALSSAYVRNVFCSFRVMRLSGRRYGVRGIRLFCRLFPHVFFFSLSVVYRRVRQICKI